MTKDKERDDALIAEALANTNNARSSWRDEMRVSMAEVLRLERSGWQPKPDRWTLAWDEATITFAKTDDEQAAIAVLRKHFPEAEQEVVPRDVAESWKARADNLKEERQNLLSDLAIMMGKHVENWPEPKRFSTAIALIDKTLTEALSKREAERPAVVVPMSAKMWAESVLNLRGAINATCEREAARFILSLDGAKGGE